MPEGDDPIEPCESEGHYVAEVIDLAGIRVQWGLPKVRAPHACRHVNLTYSSEQRRVWCKDCERTIENFDAFMVLVNGHREMVADARHKSAQAAVAMTATIHRRATKAIDRIWSGHVMAICCPHCQGGLLPEDFADGIGSQISREFEIARRRRAQKGN